MTFITLLIRHWLLLTFFGSNFKSCFCKFAVALLTHYMGRPAPDPKRLSDWPARENNSNFFMEKLSCLH